MSAHDPPSDAPNPDGAPASCQPPIDRAVLGEWLGDDQAGIDAMLVEFRDSIVADYATMLSALDRGDLVEYGLAVHRLRGAALSMGAKPLAQAAAPLDIAARAKDLAECRAGLPELEARLGQMLAHAPKTARG